MQVTQCNCMNLGNDSCVVMLQACILNQLTENIMEPLQEILNNDINKRNSTVSLYQYIMRHIIWFLCHPGLNWIVVQENFQCNLLIHQFHPVCQKAIGNLSDYCHKTSKLLHRGDIWQEADSQQLELQLPYLLTVKVGVNYLLPRVNLVITVYL